MADIVVIDYGMGNVRSVEKALAHCGASVEVTDDPKRLNAASHIVLPGVGAFGDAMAELRRRGLVEPIRERIGSGIPFLGVCLGQQILFEKSEESPGVEGLSVIPGKVRRFQTQLKVPHMGWNALEIRKPTPLLDGLGQEPHVYFVHSYYVAPTDSEWVVAVTNYDGEFVSVVGLGNCYATQFHPEKSQKVGLQILRNFIAMEQEKTA
jgi:glutamine amidotransferase